MSINYLKFISYFICIFDITQNISFAQEFREGKYMLQPLGSSKYLDVSGSCERQNGCKVQLYSIGKSPKNNIFLIEKSNYAKAFGIADSYNLKCISNNKVLDADYQTISTEGCRIQVWDLFEAPVVGDPFKGNQDFIIEQIGRNQFRFWSHAPPARIRQLGVQRSQRNQNHAQVALYSNSRNVVTTWVLTAVND